MKYRPIERASPTDVAQHPYLQASPELSTASAGATGGAGATSSSTPPSSAAAPSKSTTGGVEAAAVVTASGTTPHGNSFGLNSNPVAGDLLHSGKSSSGKTITPPSTTGHQLGVPSSTVPISAVVGSAGPGAVPGAVGWSGSGFALGTVAATLGSGISLTSASGTTTVDPLNTTTEITPDVSSAIILAAASISSGAILPSHDNPYSSWSDVVINQQIALSATAAGNESYTGGSSSGGAFNGSALNGSMEPQSGSSKDVLRGRRDDASNLSKIRLVGTGLRIFFVCSILKQARYGHTTELAVDVALST